MPALSTLAVFAVAVLALLVIPGPNHIYIATRSAAQGRAAGLASAFGVECGTLVHIAAATVGLSALVASSDAAFDAVRYLGAAYLVWLGVSALRARDGHGDGEPGAVAPASRGKLFRDGLLVNVLNPKVILFFLAFLPQFLDPGRGPVALQTLVLGAVLVTLGMTSNVLYVLGASALAARVRRRRGARAGGGAARWLTGGVYLSLGAFAAVAGGRH